MKALPYLTLTYDVAGNEWTPREVLPITVLPVKAQFETLVKVYERVSKFVISVFLFVSSITTQQFNKYTTGPGCSKLG